MQTQQVTGVAGSKMLYASRTTSVKAPDNGFEQLMQMSQAAGTVDETSKTSTPTEKNTVSSGNETKAADKKDAAASRTDTSATTEKKPDSGKTEEIKEATDIEAAERVAGVLAQVTEAVKEVLGLTQEQLEAFMEEQGITELDLLQPEALKNLTLAVNSEQDAVVLLTDAELLSTVNQLLNEVEQVLQEAGATPEELLHLMEESEFETAVFQAMEHTDNTPSEQEETSTTVEKTFAVQPEETGKETATERTEKKETGSSSDRNSDNSTDVEQFTEQFVQQLQKSVEQTGELDGSNDMVAFIREIADQILEKVKVSITPETTSLEIVLTPEELGRVNLTVSAEQDGTLKAKFVTENDLAREAIEKNLVQFKEMLQEQGLQVDTIEVMVGNFEFDKNGQTGEKEQEEKKHGSHRFISDEEISTMDETDQMARIFLEGGESTVNYMA